MPLYSFLECLHCSAYRFTTALGARYIIFHPPLFSIFLTISYALSLTFTRHLAFTRSSALSLHADKSSGRWLCYCMGIQFFSPGFCCKLCLPLLPAILTTIVLSLFSLRCIPPILTLNKSRRLYLQPRSRTSNLELPLSDRSSLRSKCFWPTLI